MRSYSTSGLPARRRRNAAFSLMEMLLVIGLMGVLMGVMALGFGNIFGQNEVQIAGMFVKQSIKPNLQQYRMHMGSYPSTQDGLDALLEPPNGDKSSRWKGPYADTIPADPWGNPYQYCYPGVHNKYGYDIWSMGPDGQDGTSDDIGNWDDAE